MGDHVATTDPRTDLQFDASSIEAIGVELGVVPKLAKYSAGGGQAWELDIPTDWMAGGSLRVVVWPSIGRVDVRVRSPLIARTPLAFTAKSVSRVVIYPGVEVAFQRSGGSVLFVTRSGHAAIAD